MHRQLLRHKGTELLGRGLTDDECHNALPEIRVRKPDNGNLDDTGMTKNCGLDLAGADPISRPVRRVGCASAKG